MVESLNDAELLRRFAREREELALAELVRRYLGLVYHAALRQIGGDAHAAEEVSQRVFTLLARKATTLSRHATLVGWLHTTTRNIAREMLRAERRRREREREAYSMSEYEQAPSEEEWARLRPLVDEAVSELSEKDREAVLLRFFVGLPHAEIGARFGVSENGARMRVERALEKLRVVLARRGVTSSAGALGTILTHGMAATTGIVPPGLAGGVAAAAWAGSQAAGGIGAWLIFMSTAKTWGSAAGLLLLIAAGGVVTMETRARAVAESYAVKAEAGVAAKLTVLREMERRLAVAENELAGLEREKARQAEAATIATAAAKTAAVGASAWDPVEEGRSLMEQNPALKQAVIAKADAGNRFRYQDGLKALGMSDAQIDQFLVLMREYDFQGVPFGPKGQMYAFPAGEGLSNEETNRRLKALMGEANHAKLGELTRADEARRAAISLASKLALTEAAVTTEQTERLQRLLLENRHTKRQRGQPSFNWEVVMAQAAAGFSPRQMEALARVRAEAQRSAATSRPMPSMPAQKTKGKS